MLGKRAESITNTLIIMCQLFETEATLADVCARIDSPIGTIRARKALIVKLSIELSVKRLPGRGYGIPVFKLNEPLEDAIQKIKQNYSQEETCVKCGNKLVRGEFKRKAFFPDGYCIPCTIKYLKIHGMVCTICGQHLPWDEFGISKNTKIGKNLQCKACTTKENDTSGRYQGYGIESWFFINSRRSNEYLEWCDTWTVKGQKLEDRK